MAPLDPGAALTACETALRELMAHAYSRQWGEGWLDRIASEEQRSLWAERAEVESGARGTKGVAVVPDDGLSYANFFDLISIAGKQELWEPLAPALGKRADVLPLLKRLDSLRNAVGHSRPLLSFERDLISGIAGQIRNQVTIYMSSQDPAGELYPRIESVVDSLGTRLEEPADSYYLVGGGVWMTGLVLHPGQTIEFECLGTDPQDRDLLWRISSNRGGYTASTVARSADRAVLTWTVSDDDVSERTWVTILLGARDARYHRLGDHDHHATFDYKVRP